MIKRKPKAGTIIEIQLSNGRFAYGQVLNEGSIAFLNTFEEQQSNVEYLSKLDIIFIVTPYNHAYRTEGWNTVGKASIRPELEITPNTFIQDALNAKGFQIYNPNTGEIKDSTKEEYVDLECCAVWESNHIEDRLIDHFMGTENVWVKQLEIK